MGNFGLLADRIRLEAKVNRPLLQALEHMVSQP